MKPANFSINKQDIIALFLTGALLLLYYFNFFFNLENLLIGSVLLLLAVAFTILIVRYKELTLYSLSFLIPISIPIKIGGSVINIPSEIICVLLSGFFIVKIILGAKISKKFIAHPVTLFVLLDLTWLFITSCTSEMPLVSFKRLVIKLVYYICFYYFYFELFQQNKNNIKKVLLLHCLGLLIPIVSATVFHSKLGFNTMGSQLASAPYYNDHTMYGAILVFFIPFLFSEAIQKIKLKKGQYSYTLLVLIFLFAGFLSYSRAAWLTLIISCVIGLMIILKLKLKHYALLILLALIIGFFKFDSISESFSRNKQLSHGNDVAQHFKSISNVNSDASNKERINRWKCALRMSEEKPFLGFGPGTYQFFYGKYQIRTDLTHISTFNGTKGHAHSEYLNSLSETGVFGLLFFISLIISVIYFAVKLIRKSKDEYTKKLSLTILMGLLTFYLHAFFNGFLEFDKLAMPVFMSMAAIVSMSRGIDPEDSDRIKV